MTEHQAHKLLLDLITSTFVRSDQRLEAQCLLEQLKQDRPEKSLAPLVEALGRISQEDFCGAGLFFFMCFAYIKNQEALKYPTLMANYQKSKRVSMKEARIAYMERDTPSEGPHGKRTFPSPDEHLLYIEDFLMKHDSLLVSSEMMMRYVETLYYADIVELVDMIYSRGVNIESYLNELCYKVLDRHRGLRRSQVQDLRTEIENCMSTMRQLIPDIEIGDVTYIRDIFAYHSHLVSIKYSPDDKLTCFFDAYVMCLLYKSYPKLIVEKVRMKNLMAKYMEDRSKWFQDNIYLECASTLPGIDKSAYQPVQENINQLVSREYSDHSVVEKLAAALRSHIQMYSESQRPYWTCEPPTVGSYMYLQQSRGVGKTKLLLSLGSEALVFYISIRGKTDNDALPKGSLIVNTLFGIKSCEAMHCFIAAMLQTFAEGFNDGTSRIEYLDMATEDYGKSFSRQEPNPLKRFSDLLADRESRLHKAFWSAVSVNYQNSKQHFSPRSDKVAECWARVQKRLQDASVYYEVGINCDYYVIAFDNANYMINDKGYRYYDCTFDAARCASRYIIDSGIMIFCDSFFRTRAGPAEEYQVDHDHPVVKDFFPRNFEIPLWNVIEIDPHLYNNPGAQRMIKANDCGYKRLSFNVFDEVKKSRAVILSCLALQEPNAPCDIDTIYAHVGSIVNNYHDLDENDASAITLFGLPYFPVKLGEKFYCLESILQKSFQNTTSVLSGEPCIVEALLRKKENARGDCNIILPLENFEKLLLSETIILNYRQWPSRLGAVFIVGSLITRNRNPNERYNDPLFVLDFFYMLVSESYAEDLFKSANLEAIENSFLGCTSTVPTETMPTKELLLDAFERRALILLDGEDSTDLIMPVVLNEPKADGGVNIRASLSNIGMIPFRVMVDGDEPVTVDQVKKACTELTDLVNRAGQDFALGGIFYIGRLGYEGNHFDIDGRVFALIDYDKLHGCTLHVQDDLLK